MQPENSQTKILELKRTTLLLKQLKDVVAIKHSKPPDESVNT